jgi:hypothetical protein
MGRELREGVSRRCLYKAFRGRFAPLEAFSYSCPIQLKPFVGGARNGRFFQKKKVILLTLFTMKR